MEQITSDLRAEHDTIDAVLTTLDERGWRQPTPAAGWNVADNIVHIGYYDDTARLAIVDPEAFERRKNDLISGRVNFSAMATERTGTELLAWWRESRSGLYAALAPLDPKARIAWFGPSMGALSFASARLMESWSHGHDVLDALGAAVAPTDRLRHIAHIGVTTRGWSYVNRGLMPPDVPIRVELTAPSGAIWTWGAEDAADLVRGDALDFCLVVTQRRPLSAAALEIRGEAATEWMAIAQAFAGPPTLTDVDRVG